MWFEISLISKLQCMFFQWIETSGDELKSNYSKNFEKTTEENTKKTTVLESLLNEGVPDDCFSNSHTQIVVT